MYEKRNTDRTYWAEIWKRRVLFYMDYVIKATSAASEVSGGDFI